MIVAPCLCGKGAKGYEFCGEHSFDGEKDPIWGHCRSLEETLGGRVFELDSGLCSGPPLRGFRVLRGARTLPEFPASPGFLWSVVNGPRSVFQAMRSQSSQLGWTRGGWGGVTSSWQRWCWPETRLWATWGPALALGCGGRQGWGALLEQTVLGLCAQALRPAPGPGPGCTGISGARTPRPTWRRRRPDSQTCFSGLSQHSV